MNADSLNTGYLALNIFRFNFLQEITRKTFLKELST